MHSPKNYFSLIVTSLFIMVSTIGCGQTSFTDISPTTTPASSTPIASPETTTTKQISWCDTEMRTAVTTVTPKKDGLWIFSEFFNGMSHEPTINHVCQDTTELFSFSAPDYFLVTTTNSMTLVTGAYRTLVIGGFHPAEGRPRLTIKTKPFQKIVYTKDLSDPKKIPVALYYSAKDRKAENELMAIVQTINN